jgi:hypothetical protein
MGGSSSSDKKTTNITTTTQTTMRDVGLTGQNAVDMAAVLQTGAIERTRISAASLDNIIQTVGKTSQQLVGGASNLVQAQKDLLEDESGMMKLAPWIAVAAIAIPLIFIKGKR